MLWSNVVLAYGGAIGILLFGRRAPVWFFHAALATGAVLITRAVFLSGEAVSFYAAWYTWIGLYAFYFFSRRAAVLHVGFTAALYGVTLAHESASSPVARWLTAVSTLVVAGAFIDTLVRRAHQHASTATATADCMATVARVAHELSTVTDGAIAREALCRTARDVTGADQVVLWEPLGDGTGLGSSSSAVALEERLTVTFVGPPSGVGRAYTTAATGSDEDSVWQPVLQGESAVAVLAVHWESPHAISETMRTLVELLAAETAATLQRVALVERLEVVARTDDLTGLPNRRAWNEQLGRELARAQRTGDALCVAILDLDHFKAFNDSFGHQAGDRLLKQAAARWSGELRASDLLARYGGEEFALALPGMGPEHAAEVIERLRRVTPEGETCSAGAVWWDGSESADRARRPRRRRAVRGQARRPRPRRLRLALLPHGGVVAQRRVAALRLDGVERHVGREQQIVRRRRVVGVLRDADADRPVVAGLDAARHLQRAGRVGRREDQGELVAAEPGREVDAPAGGQYVGQLAQRGVARGVAALVVDRLEAVDVDGQQAERLAGALGAVELLVEALLECAAVGQPGQRVGVRGLVELEDQRVGALAQQPEHQAR